MTFLESVVAAHEIVRHLTEKVLVPEHVKRLEDPTAEEYRKNHHILVQEMGLPCWICGSRENLETHHWFEWSLWNDLDPDQVQETLRLLDPYGFSRHLTDPITSPDDIRNLVVLCRPHHTGQGTGIHEITWPILLALKAAKSGTQIIPPSR